MGESAYNGLYLVNDYWKNYESNDKKAYKKNDLNFIYVYI